MLDDALARTPLRPDAILARANLHLLAGESDRAADLADTAVAMPDAPPRLVAARHDVDPGVRDAAEKAIRRITESR